MNKLIWSRSSWRMCQPGLTSCVTNSPHSYPEAHWLQAVFFHHHGSRGIFVGHCLIYLLGNLSLLCILFQFGPPLGPLWGWRGKRQGPHLSPGEAGKCELEVCLGAAVVWSTPVVSALGNLRQEDHQFEASLGCTRRSRLA